MIKNRVLTVLAVAGATCIAAAPAAAAPIHECGHISEVNGHEVPGSPGGILNLTTRNVACGAARGFSVRVTEHWGGPVDGSRVFDGFECRGGPLGMYEIDIRCVKGPDVIHWQLGD